METQLEQQDIQEQVPAYEAPQFVAPKASSETGENLLKKGVEGLSKFGGFSLIETLVDGSQNMNDERKARKKIFLSDPEKKKERYLLKERLSLWLNILSSDQDQDKMLMKAQGTYQEIEAVFKENAKEAISTVKDLEQSYRSLASFYQNAEVDKVRNLNIMNASMDQVTDLDNPRFYDHVSDELKANYDRLDLKDNYSIMVIPGYLGSNRMVEKWAKVAHDSKVMLVTDFENLENPDDVVDLFTDSDLAGNDLYRSNVMMTCNWLVGRKKIEELEVEELYLPPSASLAGKIHSTLMSQVTAGKKFGALADVDSVRFPLRKSEISHLERIGIVPMVNEYNKVMAFSAKTLFNGDNVGLQTYSVVRVFDYITKVLFDFLNRKAFENWTSQTESELRGQIVRFLDSIKGHDKLIERFQIKRFERDPNQKDKINLDLHIVPYFPAKSFMIKLDGHKGDDGGVKWGSNYGTES